MSGRHACAGMPRGIALVEGAGGWHVRFERAGSEWAREVTHCPWCGRRLGGGEGAPPRRETPAEKRRKGGMRRASPARCVETGEVFETQTAAALAVGTTPQSVSSAVRDGHRAGGCHWERA